MFRDIMLQPQSIKLVGYQPSPNINTLRDWYSLAMAKVEIPVWDAEPGDQLTIESPAIGEVNVLVSATREQTTLQDGRTHLVFVRGNGRMVGINVPQEIDVDRSLLVEDTDRFQHALVKDNDGDLSLFTRRPPGEPDDWERRESIETSGVIETDD